MYNSPPHVTSHCINQIVTITKHNESEQLNYFRQDGKKNPRLHKNLEKKHHSLNISEEAEKLRKKKKQREKTDGQRTHFANHKITNFNHVTCKKLSQHEHHLLS